MAGSLSELRNVSLSQLQVSGGDDRLPVDPKTGCNKYNTPNHPCPDAVRRSSTTSNVLSHRGHVAASAMLHSLLASSDDVELRDAFQIAMDLIRDKIMACYNLPSNIEVVLTPSGSDAEFLPLLVALSRKPSGGTLNIVTAAGEVGSGTTNACRGCHFSSTLPSGVASANGASTTLPGSGSDFLQAREVFLRQEGGEARPCDEIEREVENLAEAAIKEDRIVLMHIVAGSKTGANTPSEGFARNLQQRFGPEKIIVIVDACQLRVKQHKIGRWLKEGWHVLITGSKFFGAPPFCGAVLMPDVHMHNLSGMVSEFRALGDYFGKACFSAATRSRQANQSLSDRMNFGLLLRWSAALAEMELYFGTNEELRSRFLHQWVQGAKGLVRSYGESTGHLKLALLGNEPDPDSVALDGVNSLLAFQVFARAKDASTKMIPLSQDELKKFHALMPRDLSTSLAHISSTLCPHEVVALKRPCYIGQPVKLSADVVVIRFAADAPLVNDICSARDASVAMREVLSDDEVLVTKMVLIARFWDDLMHDSKKTPVSHSRHTFVSAMPEQGGLLAQHSRL